MNIAYRFRIYPTEEQKILLGKTFGCCRFLYNQMLDDKIREYEKTKKMLKNTPAMYKREYPFLKEVDSLALEMSSFIWKRHIYHCECGNKMDRDHNSAINIREEARSPHFKIRDLSGGSMSPRSGRLQLIHILKEPSRMVYNMIWQVRSS